VIYAKLEELRNYIEPEIFEKVAEFLSLVNEDMAEEKYPIIGDRVFARVMSYDTNDPSDCKIEAHDKYIDIQATITGAEGISVFDRSALTELNPYNPEKDVVNFVPEGAEEVAHTSNIPGYFTMLYPQEAHRPKEIVRGINRVKKFVIKVLVQ